MGRRLARWGSALLLLDVLGLVTVWFAACEDSGDCGFGRSLVWHVGGAIVYVTSPLLAMIIIAGVVHAGVVAVRTVAR